LDAVKTDSLPFIYLYTDRPDLDEIVLHIYSYMSSNSSDYLKENYEILCDEFEEFIDEEDAKELLNGMKNKFKECILKPDKIKEVKREIVTYLKEKLGIEQEEAGIKYAKLIEIGKSLFNCSDKEVFNNLGLCLNNGLFRDETVSDIEIKPIEWGKYTYLINNTLVKISNKTTAMGTDLDFVSAEQVYSDFSKTISKRPNNFLALLGLEMRTLYRERCSIIGKDINEINELAFFHHQKSLEPEEDGAFYEFLSNMWKDEVSSFILNQKPTLFSVLDDYKDKNDIDRKLTEFSSKFEVVNENLAKLNYYYTTLRITHKERQKIRFGDIFCIENVDLFNWDEIIENDICKKYLIKNFHVEWLETAQIEKSDDGRSIKFYDEDNSLFFNLNNEKTKAILTINNFLTDEFIVKMEDNKPNLYKIDISYLLCVTPHCDCLRPSKINNYFYFVGGKKIKLSQGLKKGDTGFISYIKTEKGLYCIEWEKSPFTINISNEKNIINPIECDLMGQKITLKHLTWQKENYTQRIANESFSHASRVGINLAKI